MITGQEKEIILKCAKEKDKEYDDIDVGVKGIDTKLFFKL